MAPRLTPKARFWEIDLFRGIAVMMMIVFHVVFDLSFFSILPVNVSTGFWRFFAMLTASIFIFLVGLSLHISQYRMPVQPDHTLFIHYLTRGGSIFGLGLLITLITYLFVGEGFIIFGILHCIGVSILITPLFFERPKISLLTAISILIAGFLITGITGPVWFAWLGVHPPYFYTLDYFPLVPWLGVVLLGLTAGIYLYPRGTRSLPLSDHYPQYTRLVCWMGRHSLAIYLLHQPVILLLLNYLFPTSIWILP